MRVSGFLIVAVALAVVISMSGVARSQAERSPGVTSIKVYSLKNVSAIEAAHTLAELVQGRGNVVPNERTNSLLAEASAEMHDEIAHLLAELDQPIPAGAMDIETVMIPLRHVAAESVLSAIRLYLSPAGRVISSQQPNGIVVQDTRTAVARVQAAVSQFDVECPSVRIQCWLLAHDAGDSLAGTALDPVAKELEGFGLTGYGIISHAAVESAESNRFETQQSFRGRTLQQLSLAGTVRLSNQGREAALDLNCQLALVLEAGDSGEAGRREPKQEQNGEFSLRTMLKAPIGDFVIAGLAPTGNENSRPVVLVIRIDR